MPTLKFPVLIKTPVENSSIAIRIEENASAPIPQDEIRRIKIIVPDLEYAFYISNPDELSHLVVKKALIDYLTLNPHKLNVNTSFSQENWKIKNHIGYQTRWLQSHIDGENGDGVIIELNTKNLPAQFQYFIPIIIISTLFLLNVVSWAYFDSLITAVNLPDANEKTTMVIVLGRLNAVNDCFQSVISYFAMNTPQYIDLISRKIAQVCQKKEYDLNDDFEVETTNQVIKTTLMQHPIKATSITLISLMMISSTLFGAVMTNIVGYDQAKSFLTKAHDMKMSEINLQTLITTGMTIYVIGSVFSFFIQFEMFGQAIKAALLVYEVLSKKWNDGKNFSACCNPFCLFFSKQNAESVGEHERLIQSV